MPGKKTAKKQQVIILIGAPGSGKGTQAELLAEKFNFYSLETSKILEENFRNAKKGDAIEAGGKKYDLLNEKKLWESGILMSPPLVACLLKRKITELYKEGKSLILSGSPRTLIEGKDIMPFLQKLYGKSNIRILFLQTTPEATIWRNSHRRICELMRHSMVYSKEVSKLRFCPLDGSKLIRRKGLDDPEIIKVRLKEFQERTFPLIQFFKDNKMNLKNINGEQSVEAVFKNVLKALE